MIFICGRSAVADEFRNKFFNEEEEYV